MQDSIIVYRNPLEKAFWESSSTNVLAIIAMVAVSVIIFAAVVTPLGKCRRGSFLERNCVGIALTISIALGLTAMYYVSTFGV